MELNTLLIYDAAACSNDGVHLAQLLKISQLVYLHLMV